MLYVHLHREFCLEHIFKPVFISSVAEYGCEEICRPQEPQLCLGFWIIAPCLSIWEFFIRLCFWLIVRYIYTWQIPSGTYLQNHKSYRLHFTVVDSWRWGKMPSTRTTTPVSSSVWGYRHSCDSSSLKSVARQVYTQLFDALSLLFFLPQWKHCFLFVSGWLLKISLSSTFILRAILTRNALPHQNKLIKNVNSCQPL